ncbi:YiiD C-terminal domain-containing protein [Roseibacillus ishigakijimensis]|uniref:YiiD C-terminal domain-containing protein n=1 Tax=Roseibacillus ishigakijimensis TaxID=454146 RepID=A0A934RRW8_9BACT|nr:YiiD C-terminal domain-containing protein [Roseibacillus ishigakijimensis]MBK1834343.1 YiiD C-terminal domain-containing protein [Roseibacillus ishigakijimensis]
MTPEELTAYLGQQIPLSRALGVRVELATPTRVLLRAPFAPNVNHQCTVFGGSASAVAILAAWSLMHVRLRTAGLCGELVIQRNSMEYLEPFAEEFVAEATLTDEGAWARFCRLYQRRGRARQSISATLHCRGRKVAAFEGAFVALARGAGGDKVPG